MKPSKVCIKPSRTSGSRGFVILNENPPTARDIFYKKAGFQEMTIDEFRKVLERSSEIPKLLLMEYLTDMNYDSNMVCRDGEVLFQSVKTREEAKVGTITKGEIVDHPEIFEINKKIAQALGTTGLIAAQYIGNKLIEINPRWSTSLDYKSISEYRMGVQIFTGEPFDYTDEDLKEYQGLRMVRYWDVVTYKP